MEELSDRYKEDSTAEPTGSDYTVHDCSVEREKRSSGIVSNADHVAIARWARREALNTKAETTRGVIPAHAGIQSYSSWIPGLALLARNDRLPPSSTRVEAFVSGPVEGNSP